MSREFVVAFDWNGTLLDDSDRTWNAAARVLNDLGLGQPTRVAFFENWCLPLTQMFRQLGVSGAHLDWAVSRWNDEIGRRHAPLALGARKLVTEIHSMGGAVGVISAASTSVVERDASRLGLTSQFDFIIGNAIPKREALIAVSPSQPARMVYLGDTEYDVLEAKAAGAWAIGYGAGYRSATALTAAGADHVITRLDALLPLLRDLDAFGWLRTGAFE